MDLNILEKDQLNKILTSCMGDSYLQKSIGTSKDLLDCFLYSIDSVSTGQLVPTKETKTSLALCFAKQLYKVVITT